MAEETGGGRAFGDRLAGVVREVVDDIRTKVVEEPWFGRPVTEKLSDIHQSLDAAVERTREPGMDRFYGRGTDPEPQRAQLGPAAPVPVAPEPTAPEAAAPARSYGIDR